MAVCTCLSEKINSNKLATVVELGLTRRVAPVGGIVVTVSLLAVSMAAVFRTDQISLLEGRAAKPIDNTYVIQSRHLQH